MCSIVTAPVISDLSAFAVFEQIVCNFSYFIVTYNCGYINIFIIIWFKTT